MGLNDKYNLTLALAEGQTEEKVCAIGRSYPNVGVGQILKRYLEYFSSYKHFSKLKRRTRTWVQMTKYDLTLTREKVKLRKRCVLLKGLTLRLVWAKY